MWAQTELAECSGTGTGYGTRRTLTDSHGVEWVLSTGQTGYLGANSATNHNKVKPTAADLPVVKAVKADATTSTTGYYLYYTTTAVANVGSLTFSYTANSGNSAATAYVVVGDAKSASGGDAYEVIKLSDDSPTAQNASLGTSGTFTYKFATPQSAARYYGFVIVTSSYKRMTGGTIKLIENVPVTGVSLDESELDLEVGGSQTLTATIAPSNASNKNVIWSSSDETVASVDDGLVSALKVGTATITATTEDGNKTATCTVTVSASTNPLAVVSKTSIDFGTIAINTASVQTFTIPPANLSSALIISCDNAKYIVSPTTIAADVTTETIITVTANPTAKKNNMDGTITISGGGLAEDKTVTLSAMLYDPDETTFNFSDIDGFKDWGSSYAEHVATFPEIVVSFSSANKQTGTITDIPVQKQGDVVITANRIGDTMKSVTFTCRQWTTKTQSIELYYSTDGGTTWTKSGEASTTFSISDDDLPVGTNAVKLTSTEDNQVGIESVTIGFNVPATETVVVTDAGFATYVGDHNLNFSGVAGLKAYRAEVTGNTVRFYEVTEVPAGEGVLLKADADTYNVPTMNDAAAITNDFVRGTDAAVASEVDGTYNFILNKVNDVVAFYAANGKVVAKNRAYLQTTTAPAAARLAIVFDDEATTGVTEIVNSKLSNSKYFDLQGRRVAQPTKGLYIVNGKKVIIK